MLTDLTGPYSEVTGEKSVLAVQMAVDDFKAAHPDSEIAQSVEVISGDTKNDPAVANTSAQRMISQGADIILDVPNSAAALAVSKVAESSKKLFIAVSAGPVDLIGSACNEYSYLWGATAATYATTIGTYVTANGGKTWYIPYPDYTFGSDFANALKTTIEGGGGEVLAMDATPFPTENFSPIMLKAQSLNPDVLMLIQAGSDLANAVAAYNQFGLADSDMELAIGGLAQSDIEAIGSDNLDGAISAVAFYWNRNDESREFSEKFQAVSGGILPNNLNAGSYSAATQYLEAVLRAETDGADAVRDELNGTTFSDVFAQNAEIRAADHAVIKDMFVTRAKASAEITIPDDTMEIPETLPANEAWPAPSSACSLG